MTKQRNRKSKRSVALGHQAERSEISRATQQRGTAWRAVETLNEFEAEDEAGVGIQIIDLEEEDEEELDDELAEELAENWLDEEVANSNPVYTAVSPALTAEDLAADWQRAQVTGEETPGGTVSTPDQDRVDNIGRAAGVMYADDEPLDFAEKIGQRDRARWELDPASIDPDTRALAELAEEEAERAKNNIKPTRS